MESLNDAPAEHEDSAPDEMTGVDVRTLPAGTGVTVETRNSSYQLVLIDPRRQTAVIQGGHLFPEEIEGRIEGSTLGGSPLLMGRIEVGCHLELQVDGERIVTSCVRAIKVEAGASASGALREFPESAEILPAAADQRPFHSRVA